MPIYIHAFKKKNRVQFNSKCEIEPKKKLLITNLDGTKKRYLKANRDQHHHEKSFPKPESK